MVEEHVVEFGAKFYCYFFSGRKPKVKSLKMSLVKDGRKMKLVCKVKSKSQEVQILWRKDGQPVQPLQGKIKIRQRR